MDGDATPLDFVTMADGNYTSGSFTYRSASSWSGGFENTNFTDIMDITSGNSSNSSIPNGEIPRYYSWPYRIVGCVFVSTIFLVGFVGNVMVVIVVSRIRSMHTTTNCYLVSLAVADCLLLISAPLPTLVDYHHMIDQWIFGWALCSLMVFTQYLGVNASSLSITAFTVERYIAICHPMRAQTMCTVKRAKRIIAALWIFGVCYCSPWLGLTWVRPVKLTNGVQYEKCTFKLERSSYLVIYMADLLIFYVFPLTLTCILYGLIARILFSKKMPATPGTGNGGKRAANARVQVIKMLAIVVGLFATLWMPYRVYVVYNSFAPKLFQDYWFLLFCRLMVYMNSAINPILYNAMSVKFRRAFKRLLSCGRKTTFDPKSFLYSEVECNVHAGRKLRFANGHDSSTSPMSSRLTKSGSGGLVRAPDCNELGTQL